MQPRIGSQFVSPPRTGAPANANDHLTQAQHHHGAASLPLQHFAGHRALPRTRAVEGPPTSPPWRTPVVAPEDTAQAVLQQLHTHYEAVTPSTQSPLRGTAPPPYTVPHGIRRASADTPVMLPEKAAAAKPRDAQLVTKAKHAAMGRLAAAEQELQALLHAGSIPSPLPGGKSPRGSTAASAASRLSAAKAALRELRNASSSAASLHSAPGTPSVGPSVRRPDGYAEAGGRLTQVRRRSPRTTRASALAEGRGGSGSGGAGTPRQSGPPTPEAAATQPHPAAGGCAASPAQQPQPQPQRHATPPASLARPTPRLSPQEAYTAQPAAPQQQHQHQHQPTRPKLEARQSTLSVTFLDSTVPSEGMQDVPPHDLCVRVSTDGEPLGVAWVPQVGGTLAAASVAPGSAAERAGIQEGWRLAHVNSAAPHSEADVDRLLQQAGGCAELGMVSAPPERQGSPSAVPLPAPASVASASSAATQTYPMQHSTISRGVNTDHAAIGREEYDTLLTQVEVLQAAVEDSQAERRVLTQEISDLEGQSAAHEGRCVELQALVDRSEGLLAESAGLVQVTRQKHGNAEARIQELEEQCCSAQEGAARLEALLEGSRAEGRRLGAALAEAGEAHSASLSDEVRHKEEALALTAELEKEKEAKEDESSRCVVAESALRDARDELGELKARLVQAARAAEEVTHQRDAACDELLTASKAGERLAEQLEHQARAHTTEQQHSAEGVEKAQQQVRILQQELDMARQLASEKANETQRLSEVLEQRDEQLKGAQESSSAASQSRQEAKAQHQAEVEALRREYSRVQREAEEQGALLAAAALARQEQDAAAAELQREVEGVREEQRRRDAERSASARSAASERDSLQADNTELQAALQAHQEEIAELKRTVSRMQSERRDTLPASEGAARAANSVVWTPDSFADTALSPSFGSRRDSHKLRGSIVHFLDFVKPPDDSRTSEVWSPVRLSVIAANAQVPPSSTGSPVVSCAWRGGDLFVDRRLSARPVEGFVVPEAGGGGGGGGSVGVGSPQEQAALGEEGADVRHPPDAPSPEGGHNSGNERDTLGSDVAPLSPGVDADLVAVQQALASTTFECTNQLVCVKHSFDVLEAIREELDTTREVLAQSCPDDDEVWGNFEELQGIFAAVHGALCEHSEVFAARRAEADMMLRAVETALEQS